MKKLNKLSIIFAIIIFKIVTVQNYNISAYNNLDTSKLFTKDVDQNQIYNKTECDRECYIEKNLGPRKNNLTFTIVMTAIYIIIFLTGLFGNIATCFVIIFNNCMHTTTNYYLFSLAVSDVIFLVIGL